MISCLAYSFSKTPCSSTRKQVVQSGKLHPVTKIKRFNFQHQNPKNHLTFTGIPKIFALSRSSLEDTKEPNSISHAWDSTVMKLGAIYKFTRPYSLAGSIIGPLSMSLLPIQSLTDFSPTYLYGVLIKAIIPEILLNIYACGVNQIVDIGIDKINKPTLPLASGELSLTEATAVTTISAMLGIIMVAMFNSTPLLLGILLCFFATTAYSVDLPLMRWKSNAYLTAFNTIFQLGLRRPIFYYAHFQKYVLGRPLVYTKPVLFTIVFMTVMTGILSVLKDLPDTEGDEAFGIQTPSSMYGKEVVFRTCVYLSMALYGGAAIFGATLPLLPNKIITVFGHGILAATLWNIAKSVNINEPVETLAFYMFTWKLYFAEYFLVLFVR